MPPLRTIVADADPLARRLITSVLRDAGATVIAEARDRRETIGLVCHYRPDVAVIDAGGADLEGVDATRAIHARHPSQLVVVLAREEDERTALLALQAGASGFISKEADVEALPQALARVLGGEAAISGRLAQRLIERIRQLPAGTGGLRPIKGPLTPREWEVIDLLAPGHSTDDIAAALVISTETVRSHVKSIMRKLEVHSRGDALAAAERLRLATA
jgi:DNA-binding NarL/FixJ family response regulator